MPREMKLRSVTLLNMTLKETKSRRGMMISSMTRKEMKLKSESLRRRPRRLRRRAEVRTLSPTMQREMRLKIRWV